MNEGLVAHYRLAGSAQDLSGHENHGEICGAPLSIANRHGESDSGLDFCFPGDHVLIEDSESLKVTDQLTLAAWVKTRSLHLGRIVNKWEGGRRTCAYNLGVDNLSQVWFELSGGDSQNGQILVQIERSFINNWHHIAGTFDGHQMKLYLDGQLVAMTAYSATLNQADIPVYIGTGDGECFLFCGAVDDVRIYNVTLDDQQIAELAAID